MSLDASEMEWAVRLSAQLKSLSEVTESLTYRILELEERFAGQDHQWRSRRRARDERQSDLLDTMQGRLRETEDRLGRLEALLRMDDPPSAAPHRLGNPPLRALSTPPALALPDSLRVCEPSKDVRSSASGEMARSNHDPVDHDGVFEDDGEPSWAS
ncbi:MAG: hypothetical protein FJ083_09685 [Cyanobacteria bacterium K_Offshore_surface_m2_239]|nr:hypothetical protein [Cyanobacteria bacterium K_Offshore_surface_m2_239]